MLTHPTIDAPLGLSWSCYESGDLPCGICESCLRRAKAFAEAGVEDIECCGRFRESVQVSCK